MFKKSFHIEKDIELEIELICKRLKNSINQVQVLNWLANFEDNEMLKALKILNLVEYFDDTDIIEGYEACLSKLSQKIDKNTKLIIHPMGDYGKSGTAMIYYFKKAWKLLNIDSKIEFIPHHRNLKKKKYENNSIFILIDDLLGSGSSASSYYKTFIKPQLLKNKFEGNIFIITVYSLMHAISFLHTKHKEIEVISYQKRNKAFSEPSPFGYRNKMIEFRELSYKYGIDLFSTTDYTTGKTVDHPLGYKNSQALISFSYGTPNNSLPILWSDKNNWYPILPRSAEAKISLSKRFRKETAYLLSYAYSMEYDDILIFYSGEADTSMGKRKFVTKTDFLLFSVIRLVRRKRSIPVICQILGIREDELINIIEEGKLKNIFDEEGQLTPYAKRLYLDVYRMINKSKNYPYSNKTEEGYEVLDTLYVPTSFQGEK